MPLHIRNRSETLHEERRRVLHELGLLLLLPRGGVEELPERRFHLEQRDVVDGATHHKLLDLVPYLSWEVREGLKELLGVKNRHIPQILDCC